MSREKDLKFLRENLTYIFQLSVTVKELRGKYIKLLDPDLAKIFNSSIVRNYLLCIANLLDPVKDGRGNENISIYVLENINLDRKLVERIKTYRSKAVAHNDRSVMHQGDDYFRNYNLKPDEVEKLLEYMLESLEKELQDKFPREKITEDFKEKLEKLFKSS